MCRIKRDKKQPGTERESAVLNTVCDLTSKINTKIDTLDHHVFDGATKSWSRKNSEPQPFLRLKMCTTIEDYDYFGYTLRSAYHQTPVYALADTNTGDLKDACC